MKCPREVIDVAWRGAQQPFSIANEIVHAVIAERHAEILRRHIFELVRLVHHQRRTRGHHLAERALPDCRSAHSSGGDDDESDSMARWRMRVTKRAVARTFLNEKTLASARSPSTSAGLPEVPQFRASTVFVVRPSP